MRQPHVREIDIAAFRKRLDDFLGIYSAAMAPPADQLPGRTSIMYRHSTYPGFRSIIAERPSRLPKLRSEGAVVGFIYGFHGATGQWWHDIVHEALAKQGTRVADEWLADPFEVAELHVHPGHQGQGLGRALLTGLCAGRPERTVVLSTLDLPRSRARDLYGSVGMTDLLSDFEFPGGGPRYAVLGAALPLAT